MPDWPVISVWPDVNRKLLGVSERGVGVDDALTREDSKNSLMVESLSEVLEAGETERSRSSDIVFPSRLSL